jgi:hypothetical protein
MSLVLFPEDDDRARRMRHDVRRHAAEHHPLERAEPPRAHDDDGGVDLLRKGADLLARVARLGRRPHGDARVAQLLCVRLERRG